MGYTATHAASHSQTAQRTVSLSHLQLTSKRDNLSFIRASTFLLIYAPGTAVHDAAAANRASAISQTITHTSSVPSLLLSRPVDLSP